MNIIFTLLFCCILWKAGLWLTGNDSWFNSNYEPTNQCIGSTRHCPIPHCINQPILSLFLSRKENRKYIYYWSHNKNRHIFCVIRLLIILSGDVHPNPGPPAPDQTNSPTPDNIVLSHFQNSLAPAALVLSGLAP